MIRLVLLFLCGSLMISCATCPSRCEPKHFTQRVGQEVILEGIVAKAIWQHMIAGVPGKQEVYVDLDEKTQIVAYIEPAFNCTGHIRLTGKVMELRGGSKRGGKIDDQEYLEHHLDVTRWECLD